MNGCFDFDGPTCRTTRGAGSTYVSWWYPGGGDQSVSPARCFRCTPTSCSSSLSSWAARAPPQVCGAGKTGLVEPKERTLKGARVHRISALPVPTSVRRDLGSQLRPAGPDLPWHGRRFSAGWGTRSELRFHPVHPEVVVEFLADTAVDDGRYRHPVRFLRVRTSPPTSCPSSEPDLRPYDRAAIVNGRRMQVGAARACRSPRAHPSRCPGSAQPAAPSAGAASKLTAVLRIKSRTGGGSTPGISRTCH